MTYHAGTTPVDFDDAAAGAVTAINAWCAQATGGMIDKIVDQSLIGSGTRLVAVDAVHFSAPWQQAFAHEAITVEPFHRTGKGDAQASYLRATRAYAAAALDGVQVVALPYAGGQLEAVVVVPTDPDGLGALDARLDAPELARLAQAPQPGREVALALPRLHLAGAPMLLRDTLCGMGMPSAFQSGAADFSAISTTPVYIAQVVHRCVIDLDERGTTAAAATAAMMPRGRALRAPEPPLVVRADHPFLLLIRHKPSGTILFIARVADPSQP